MTENRTVVYPNGSYYYEQEFDWDSKQQGLVLSSFFYGYACTQFIGGIMAAKFGGHIVINVISIIEKLVKTINFITLDSRLGYFCDFSVDPFITNRCSCWHRLFCCVTCFDGTC